jgi:WD40 repeat protein
MKIRTLFAVLISFAILTASCGTQATPIPTLAPTETLTPIPPTETPTLTPSPEPTSTPTATPTPIGGKDGLLLYQAGVDKDGNFEQKIFLYNLVSNELVPFLDGYAPLDVSPDGNQILLIKYKNIFVGDTGDLFILDLAQPEKITLLHEKVEEATWLGDSDWIGLIKKVNGKRQGFIVHPDGSELTQVTKSSVGVVRIEPVFNDGVFWHEGTVTRRSGHIIAVKWTKLDGTQMKFTNFVSVSPDGKYVITVSRSNENNIDVMDLETGETKEISFSKPDNNVDISAFASGQLSEDKWLFLSFDQAYWIYSSDGRVITKIPNEYRIVHPSALPGSYDLLSPDGVWILIEKFEQISTEQSKTTYYLLNTTTSEIKDIPNLYAIETGSKIVGNRYVRGEIEGCSAFEYFWVEIP